jgi:hypothetical protein
MTLAPTLNAYLEKLKPQQQDYIVWCVREYGNRPDFYRGLLPFLSAQEAANVLNHRLELIKVFSTENPEGRGVRFVRGIIGVFEDALPHKLYEDEASATIYLSDVKLQSYYKKRYDHSFHVMLIGYMAHLERQSLNYWKVTTKQFRLEHVLQLLSDICR